MLNPRVIAYTVAVLTIVVLASSIGLDFKQVVSLGVFSGIISGALLFWRFRLTFALIGTSLLLALGLIDIERLIKFMHVDIIIFLMSMMIIVGYLEERRFFEYLVNNMLKLAKQDGKKLIAILMISGGTFAALVDEVTAILFMGAITFDIAGRYKVNPIPFMLMVTFSVVIGGSATVVGNPVAILVAFAGELTFLEFLRWATPITALALLTMIGITRILFAKEIKVLSESMKASLPSAGVPEDAQPKSSQDPLLAWLLFLGTIGGLVMHSQLESLLGLSKQTMLLGIPVMFAGITLMIERERARDIVTHRVDWWTLVFFAMFFASVGTLEFVGITSKIAELLISVSGGETEGTFLLIMAITVALSPFLDNVLTVATLIPVVNELSQMGLQVYPLWWGMLFAGVFAALLTPIGATASIVAVGMIERRKLGHITLSQWMKVGGLIALPILILATVLLYIQIPLMVG